MMDDLVRFLRDRYDEEAQVAQQLDGERWTAPAYPNGPTIAVEDGLVSAVADLRDTGPLMWTRALHIARQDPAHTLRRIEAQRRILDVVLPDIDSADNALDAEWMAGSTMARDLLRCLALPYADHPDYKETWKP